MAKSQYTLKYMTETCDLAGIEFWCLSLKEFLELRDTDPSLYRKVNRVCWLRETGQQINRVPMVKGTRVKSVDTEIKSYGFDKEPSN